MNVEARIESLRMAAKAAGYEMFVMPLSRTQFELSVARIDGSPTESLRLWRPDKNNAEALELAAALKMNIEYASGRVYGQHRTADGFWINSPSIPTEGRDITDVYREAICACAALVGERMP